MICGYMKVVLNSVWCILVVRVHCITNVSSCSVIFSVCTIQCSLRWFLRKMKVVASELRLLQLVTTLCSKPSIKQGMLVKQEDYFVSKTLALSL